MTLGPLVFEPYLRPQVWGGRNLQRLFGKKLPLEGPYGESWEVSGHPHHVSRVAEGPLKDASLTDLVRRYPDELLGNSSGRTELIPFHNENGFPLLIKLLDCQELLSIQVHPNDGIAQRLLGNERGKTEAWVVLDAGPRGRIYAGFKEGIGRHEVLHHLNAGTLKQCLHSFEPLPGDCIFIPAGTVHAVGGGVVLAEVQQTSDATFRLFDWNRLGSDGKPRMLHIEQALESIDFSLGPVRPIRPINFTGTATPNPVEALVHCLYFSLERFHLGATLAQPYEDRFSIWIVAMGTVELRGENYRRVFKRGETVLIPALCRNLLWEPTSAKDNTPQLLRIVPSLQ